MDLFSLYLALLCLPLFLVVCYKQKSSGLKLPPGKKRWPIIGETWEYVMAGRSGTPEKFVNDRVDKYSSDVFKTSLFGFDMAVFCGASGNKFLFSSENKYVASWWPSSVQKILVFSDHHDHKKAFKEESAQTRSILPEFLKPEALQHYVPIMDSLAKDHLMTFWYPYKEVEVFPLSKKYAFALACRLFMSIKDPDHVTKLLDPFNLIATGIISLPIDFPGTAFNRGMKGSKLLREELLAIIKKRETELLESREPMVIDLLARMLRLSGENGRTMDDTQICNKIIGLLVAGYDTVSTVITFVMKYLAENPQVYREVLKEQMEIAKSKSPGELLKWEDTQKMKYSWCVACEAMRLAPPSSGAFREAITDFTYAGFTIPKGWKIYWTVHSTHKNSKYFSDPEKFNPSRFENNGLAPYTFVPFGGGPRMCPGKEYARLEILVFMHNVITKFKWEKVIPNEKIIFNPLPVPVNGLLIRLKSFSK